MNLLNCLQLMEWSHSGVIKVRVNESDEAVLNFTAQNKPTLVADLASTTTVSLCFTLGNP